MSPGGRRRGAINGDPVLGTGAYDARRCRESAALAHPPQCGPCRRSNPSSKVTAVTKRHVPSPPTPYVSMPQNVCVERRQAGETLRKHEAHTGRSPPHSAPPRPQRTRTSEATAGRGKGRGAEGACAKNHGHEHRGRLIMFQREERGNATNQPPTRVDAKTRSPNTR